MRRLAGAVRPASQAAADRRGARRRSPTPGSRSRPHRARHRRGGGDPGRRRGGGGKASPAERVAADRPATTRITAERPGSPRAGVAEVAEAGADARELLWMVAGVFVIGLAVALVSLQLTGGGRSGSTPRRRRAGRGGEGGRRGGGAQRDRGPGPGAVADDVEANGYLLGAVTNSDARGETHGSSSSAATRRRRRRSPAISGEVGAAVDPRVERARRGRRRRRDRRRGPRPAYPIRMNRQTPTCQSPRSRARRARCSTPSTNLPRVQANSDSAAPVALPGPPCGGPGRWPRSRWR